MKRKNPVLLTEKSKELIPRIMEIMTISEICLNLRQMAKTLHRVNELELLRALEWLRFEHILEYVICPLPCMDDVSVYYKIHR